MLFLLILILVALFIAIGGIFYAASILEEVLEAVNVRNVLAKK